MGTEGSKAKKKKKNPNYQCSYLQGQLLHKLDDFCKLQHHFVLVLFMLSDFTNSIRYNYFNYNIIHMKAICTHVKYFFLVC